MYFCGIIKECISKTGIGSLRDIEPLVTFLNPFLLSIQSILFATLVYVTSFSSISYCSNSEYVLDLIGNTNGKPWSNTYSCIFQQLLLFFKVGICLIIFYRVLVSFLKNIVLHFNSFHFFGNPSPSAWFRWSRDNALGPFVFSHNQTWCLRCLIDWVINHLLPMMLLAKQLSQIITIIIGVNSVIEIFKQKAFKMPSSKVF